MNNKKNVTLLFLILLIASFLRFFNLMHDFPYFFDPDERNMAIAISQLRLPDKPSRVPICLISQIRQIETENCNLNPHFFAYGQFPLYLSYGSDQLAKPIFNLFYPKLSSDSQSLTTLFPSAIFWLRFWSALASTFTVLFVYFITKELINKSKIKLSILAALMAAFTPGLIQSAHFGTTESFLTFFFMASIYLSIKLFSSLSHLSNLRYLKYLFLLSLTIGLGLGSKATGIFFFVPPLVAITLSYLKAMSMKRKNILIVTLWHCCIVIFLSVGSLLFAIISSPYNLIDQKGFLGSVFGYERDVAMGIYEAFYTRQFVNTVPVLFQAEKVFPYTLGWPVFILGSLGILLVTLRLIIQSILTIISKVQKARVKFFKFDHLDLFWILTFGFWIYFLPNAFLFAKWTRFATPVFPFFSIFAGYALYQISNIKYKYKKLFHILYVFLISIPGLAFMSIYTHEDSRVASSKWIFQNIPHNSYILSETANVVDIPLGLPNYFLPPPDYNLKIISFDFYHMDDNREIQNQFFVHLVKADYILIPSRRIFANYLRLPARYPLTTRYYDLLFSGKLGFEKVVEISSFPKLLGLSFPDEKAEETFTVFDHPVVRIYKKAKPLTEKEYRNLFKT